MARRHFSVEQANRMIPMLEETFGRLVQLNVQTKQLLAELQETPHAPRNEDFEIDPPGADPDTVEMLATLKALIRTMRSEIDRLQDEGCVVKHIEHGLVDWYARRGEEEVFLCWKLGEKSVGHWHEIDAGFSGRRPISEL